jgi:hypothetical protein
LGFGSGGSTAKPGSPVPPVPPPPPSAVGDPTWRGATHTTHHRQLGSAQLSSAGFHQPVRRMDRTAAVGSAPPPLMDEEEEEDRTHEAVGCARGLDELHPLVRRVTVHGTEGVHIARRTLSAATASSIKKLDTRQHRQHRIHVSFAAAGVGAIMESQGNLRRLLSGSTRVLYLHRVYTSIARSV